MILFKVTYNVPKQFLNKELYVCSYGMEQGISMGNFGPATYEYHLIHYVTEGSCKLKINGSDYQLQKGEGFYIPPNVVLCYETDDTSPWTSYWVGFSGEQAITALKLSTLSIKKPIFKYERDDQLIELFQNLLSITKCDDFLDSFQLIGILILILGTIAKTNRNRERINHHEADGTKAVYTGLVIDFIHKNYDQKITVAEIADYIGLNRSYLGTLFKKQLNMSIKEYLTRFRINKACTLLATTDLTISDIAKSVGYDDPLHFSKTFKKYKHISPSEYRIL